MEKTNGTYRLVGYTDVRARRRRMTALCVAVSLAVGAALGVAADRAGASEVSVAARIRPAVSATFARDGTVTVRSNAAWRLDAELSADTPDHMVFAGGPTGGAGTRVALEAGASVSIVTR